MTIYRKDIADIHRMTAKLYIHTLVETVTYPGAPVLTYVAEALQCVAPELIEKDESALAAFRRLVMSQMDVDEKQRPYNLAKVYVKKYATRCAIIDLINFVNANGMAVHLARVEDDWNESMGTWYSALTNLEQVINKTPMVIGLQPKLAANLPIDTLPFDVPAATEESRKIMSLKQIIHEAKLKQQGKPAKMSVSTGGLSDLEAEMSAVDKDFVQD